MNDNSKTAKKLTASVVTIIILAVCLCITTFALVFATVSVDNNLFHTGSVEINLNDGKPVIEEHEFLFEPGMTVQKNFLLKTTALGMSTISCTLTMQRADLPMCWRYIFRMEIRRCSPVLPPN